MENVALLGLDIDHVSRLVLASERSLALVNRRALAATLANMAPDPGQALPPAPPFAEAVAIAREDGQLVERIRLFLATHPRAIEELTPELTRTLVRIFDPSGRTARLINTRSPILSYAVTGAAVVGALTLLTSAALLVGTVASHITHPAGSPAVGGQSAGAVSPLALSRIPGNSSNAVRSAGDAQNSATHPAITLKVPAAKLAAHDAHAQVGEKQIASSLTVAHTNSENAARSAASATVADSSKNAPHAAAAGSASNGTVANQSNTNVAKTNSAVTPANASNSASATNDLPPFNAEAIKATSSAAATGPAKAADANSSEPKTGETKSAGTQAGTPKSAAVNAAAANGVTNSATSAASQAGQPAASNGAAPSGSQSDTDAARDSAARDYVSRNITTINPDARVEWMHSNHPSAGTIRIDALVRTNASSSVMHYTLRDDGTGFTLVDKVSTPNT